MCNFLVEIPETFKFWPLEFRPTSTTRRDRMPQIMLKKHTTCPQNRVHAIERPGQHDVYSMLASALPKPD
jgi:hypothetical protein